MYINSISCLLSFKDSLSLTNIWGFASASEIPMHHSDILRVNAIHRFKYKFVGEPLIF